jgi:hypothetical protein
MLVVIIRASYTPLLRSEIETLLPSVVKVLLTCPLSPTRIFSEPARPLGRAGVLGNLNLSSNLNHEAKPDCEGLNAPKQATKNLAKMT